MNPILPMKFQVRRFDETRALWQEIGSDAIASPYADFDWLAAWCETIGAKADIDAITFEMRQADRLLLICPLMLRRNAGLTICNWLGGHTQNINSALFASNWLRSAGGGDFDLILSGLKQALPNVDLFHLGRQPEHILGVRNPFYSQGYSTKHRDPLYQTQMGKDFSAWKSHRRSKGSLQRIERRHKQLQKSFGQVEIVQPKSLGQLESLLNTFFSQRARSAKARHVPNPFFDAKFRNFVHRAAFAGFQKNRGLQVFALVAGGSILATELVLLTRDSYSGFAKSMDLSLAKFSPGKLLSHGVLEEVHAKGIRYVDFGLGEEKYKGEWTDRIELGDSYFPISKNGFVMMTAMMSINITWRLTKNLPGARSLVRRGKTSLQSQKSI
jgi:CelD/BcsL family acetyltransferase involved in cellulose biosynthesis